MFTENAFIKEEKIENLRDPEKKELNFVKRFSMPKKILNKNIPPVPTYCFHVHLNLSLQEYVLQFKFTQCFPWPVKHLLSKEPHANFMSVRFCVSILRQYLGSCTCETMSLKAAFCTSKLIKTQHFALFL